VVQKRLVNGRFTVVDKRCRAGNRSGGCEMWCEDTPCLAQKKTQSDVLLAYAKFISPRKKCQANRARFNGYLDNRLPCLPPFRHAIRSDGVR
jgi:hypothetical protein